ncbi:hypothetical protein M378DRAFT_160590 [Amanita muscaria Koide BX008]|uniref:Uncharacterized protein n=1 Tax=Amanita muscaria (strain Koide BX008) TaxID=946122 RepID=A0A0C2XCN0_AMAMK|nr:hypothetical protein M378DRAFT_160590 [Amanita muscaria Koide BX008]
MDAMRATTLLKTGAKGLGDSDSKRATTCENMRVNEENYASLAKPFNQNLVHHSETLTRLEALTRHRTWTRQQTPQQLDATKRMALFPETAEVIYIDGTIWVVLRLEGKLCVFPGIPSLCVNGTYALLPPLHERPTRIQVFTERTESMIAQYLTTLQNKLKPRGIQIGSYPVLGKGVFVSIIGRASSSSGPSSSTSSPSPSQVLTRSSETSPISQPSSTMSTISSIHGDDPSIDNVPYAINTDGGRQHHHYHPPPLPLMEIAREVELEIAGQVVNGEEVVRCREEGGSFLSRTRTAFFGYMFVPVLLYFLR